jgi:integrase-like protein
VRSPTTTGKIERFHQSLRREFLADRTFPSLVAAQQALDVWVKEYNERIAIINWEMTQKQFRIWIRKVGIDQDRITVWDLRDNPLPLTSQTAQDELVAWLKEANAADLWIDSRRGLMGDCGWSEIDNDDAIKVQRILDPLKSAAASAICS